MKIQQRFLYAACFFLWIFLSVCIAYCIYNQFQQIVEYLLQNKFINPSTTSSIMNGTGDSLQQDVDVDSQNKDDDSQQNFNVNQQVIAYKKAGFN